MNMRYENIIEILLDKIPEIKGKYEREKDYIENLPHLVFEILFVPYFKQIMEGENEQEKMKITEFLEDMIICKDEKIQEVAVVSVLEPLLSERDYLKKIRNQLGLKTQENLKILEINFGWI